MLKPEIIKAVAVTAELIGAPLTDGGLEAMVEHLSAYETGAVLDALARCQVECRGRLALGDVIDRLDDGHPGPETAWAMVARLDDDASVVWTEDIAQAFGVVRRMLDDRVGARLAFLEDYRKRLAKARRDKRTPVWWASLGHDPAGRAAAVQEAFKLNRLTAAQVQGCLPPHEWPQPEQHALPAGDGREVARAQIDALTKQLAAAKRLPPA